MTTKERKQKLRIQFLRDQIEERNRKLAERIVTEIIANNQSIEKKSVIAIITNVLNE